jgi:triosephosphate isomerase (TIM)
LGNIHDFLIGMIMLRKPIIVANWKMHKTLSVVKRFIEEIKTMIPPKEMVDSVICPPSMVFGII